MTPRLPGWLGVWEDNPLFQHNYTKRFTSVTEWKVESWAGIATRPRHAALPAAALPATAFRLPRHRLVVQKCCDPWALPYSFSPL